ncbi:hypothetical protein C0J52_00660 [Blattella germanica]|nr:hypothetical protein C0J52_00660 [Blattella germanica]
MVEYRKFTIINSCKLQLKFQCCSKGKTLELNNDHSTLIASFMYQVCKGRLHWTMIDNSYECLLVNHAPLHWKVCKTVSFALVGHKFDVSLLFTDKVCHIACHP